MAVDKLGLRQALLDWYQTHDTHAAEGRRRLAAITGIPARTIERIEQTGSFRYPLLLKLALHTYD